MDVGHGLDVSGFQYIWKSKCTSLCLHDDILKCDLLDATVPTIFGPCDDGFKCNSVRLVLDTFSVSPSKVLDVYALGRRKEGKEGK